MELTDLNIAIQGCTHGELDIIYEKILESEKVSGKKIDLLLLCGDVETISFKEDLFSLSVPDKFLKMKYKVDRHSIDFSNFSSVFSNYLSGKKTIPIPTIFIGGNHEASNRLQELYYGGYIAPNLYFLGYSGVVNFKGVKIAGVSGIYKENDYKLGHFEKYPYSESEKRSVYHQREFEFYKLRHYSKVNFSSSQTIFLSHDWPVDITRYGNQSHLLRIKPHFREDIEQRKLGSPPLQQILEEFKPDFWFAAHLHVKFPAVFPHTNSDDKQQHCTRFLALDKVTPRNEYLQFITVQVPTLLYEKSNKICYDLEWLSILKYTHSFFPTHNNQNLNPILSNPINLDKSYLDSLYMKLIEEYGNNLEIPSFPTLCHDCNSSSPYQIQTDQLLKILELDHVWTKPHIKYDEVEVKDQNEIDI